MPLLRKNAYSYQSAFLNKEKQFIEKQNKPQFDKINQKILHTFFDFEMSPSSKDHVFPLMKIITTDDIIELKQFFRI